MTNLEERFHEIAVEEGVSDKEARDLAHTFAARVRELSAPPPDPDIIIQERGDKRRVLLKNESPDTARSALDDHEPEDSSYKLQEIARQRDRFVHKFEESEEEDEDQDIKQKFREMDEEEQREFLAQVLDE